MYIKCEPYGKVLKRRADVTPTGEYRTWRYSEIENTLLRFLRGLQLGIRPVNRVVAGAQGNHGWGRPPQ